MGDDKVRGISPAPTDEPGVPGDDADHIDPSAAGAERIRRTSADMVQRLVNHPSLLAAVAFSAFVTLRLMQAAHGNTETAYELLRGGTASVVLAALAELGPPLLLYATSLTIALRVTSGNWYLPGWFVVPCFLLTLATATIITVSFVTVVAIVGTILVRRARRRGGSVGSSSSLELGLLTIGGLVIGLIALGYLIIDDTVWLPAEVITLDDGSQLVGYPRTDGDWLRLIRDDNRAVELFPLSSVKERAVCSRSDEETSVLERPLGALFRGSPDHMVCSEFG